MSQAGQPKGQTRRRIQSLLAGRGIRPSKSLGQCFLVDLNLLQLLVEAAELDGSELVLEVGTGTGSLTELLAATARVVVTAEIDARLYDLTRQAVLCSLPNVFMLCCDALETKHRVHPLLMAAVHHCANRFGCSVWKLVANLPYNIATPLIINLLYAGEQQWERFVVTVQRELAEKMAAGPGDPDYGAVSVLVQSVAEVQILRRLGQSVFWPRPEVQSAMVQIRPIGDRYRSIADLERFRQFVHQLWSKRRKKLATACRELFGWRDAAARLEAEGLDPESRVERLPVDAFGMLFRAGVGTDEWQWEGSSQ